MKVIVFEKTKTNEDLLFLKSPSTRKFGKGDWIGFVDRELKKCIAINTKTNEKFKVLSKEIN